MDGGIGSVLPARQHRCVLWRRVRRQAKCPSMCSIRIKDVSGRAHRRRHFRLCELDSGPSPEVDGITAARQLHQRPRVILGWQSPLEYLTRLVTPLTEPQIAATTDELRPAAKWLTFRLSLTSWPARPPAGTAPGSSSRNYCGSRPARELPTCDETALSFCLEHVDGRALSGEASAVIDEISGEAGNVPSIRAGRFKHCPVEDSLAEKVIEVQLASGCGGRKV
jgi:hypothetical protein